MVNWTEVIFSLIALMFTNALLYMTASFASVSHMLGLCINTYVDAIVKEEYKVHKSKALTMDMGDMTAPRTDFNMPVDEGMP